MVMSESSRKSPEEKFIEIFGLAALQGGSVTRYLQKEISLQEKPGEKTPESAALTAVDLAVQEVILRLLIRFFSDSAVDAEEDTPTVSHFMPPGNSRSLIVIDPVDGTLNYARGSDDYAVMASFIQNGFYLASLIYFPAGDEMYWAVKGKGAWYGKGEEISRLAIGESLPDLLLVSPRVGENYRQLLADVGLKIEQSHCSAVDSLAPAMARARAAVSTKKLDRRRAIGFLITKEAGGSIMVGGRPWSGEDPENLENVSPSLAASTTELGYSLHSIVAGN